MTQQSCFRKSQAVRKIMNMARGKRNGIKGADFHLFVCLPLAIKTTDIDDGLWLSDSFNSTNRVLHRSAREFENGARNSNRKFYPLQGAFIAPNGREVN